MIHGASPHEAYQAQPCLVMHSEAVHYYAGVFRRAKPCPGLQPRHGHMLKLD